MIIPKVVLGGSILLTNAECRYPLGSPHQGSYNEYPQHLLNRNGESIKF